MLALPPLPCARVQRRVLQCRRRLWLRALLPQCLVAVCQRSRPPALTNLAYATERDGNVSLKDPSEEEAQRLLEQGTVALEVGDLEKAKVRKCAVQLELTLKGRLPHECQGARERVCLLQPRHLRVPGPCVGLGKNGEADLSGNLEGAIQAWTEAIRVAPNSPDAHTNLASAYIMSKPSRPDLATEHLRTAAAQSPDDPEIHYNLGAVLEACEELQEALQAYQRAYDGGIEVCTYTWSARQADISARDAKHPKLYGQADSRAPEGRGGQVERVAKRQPPEQCWERVAYLVVP